VWVRRLPYRRAGRKSLPNDVEHITISYNGEDQSYGIGEQVWVQCNSDATPSAD